VAPTAAIAYHAVTDDWPDPLAVPIERFRAQIERLVDRGLRGVTLANVARNPQPNEIGITFDDGFASVATTAKPILDEHGWKATVFVVTDAVGRDEPMLWLGGGSGESPSERLPLRWERLADLAASGWEIGSHGRTHRQLSVLDDDELADELRGSKGQIEEHGLSCASISYPYGEVSDRVVEASVQAGYTAGSGLAGRFRRSDPMRVPRVAISGVDGALRFAVKTSPSFLVARRTAAWTFVDSARRTRRPLGI
jgi:peptidoglycan/xylan/chitin deacetylase (PgdA/CDA1 family)